jgi:enoyl-CoA hydratase/carnithine racemase
MSKLEEYAGRYTRAALRREGGVLEVRFHDANGSSLVWDEPAHREFPDLFADLARDSDTHVVIVTGTGDTFCATHDMSSWPPLNSVTWDKIFTEGRRLLTNLLDIEVPVIAAINGPATWHAELAVLSDVVLASDDTVLQDDPHFPYSVPADGVHSVWTTLLGVNRGRYFLLTKEQIGAEEARRLGVVQEVLPKSDVLPRAWELARSFDAQDPLVLKYTRLALTAQLKRSILTDLPYGLSLEGLAGIKSSSEMAGSTG